MGTVLSDLQAKVVVGVRGFEPPTPASRTQYSTRLSYTPTAWPRRADQLWRVTEKADNSSKESLYFECGKGSIALRASPDP